MYYIALNCIASFCGELKWQREPAGNKSGMNQFPFYRLDSSSVQLSVSTQTTCQFCFWRNVPGIAASDYSSVLHQFSPDAKSLQIAATTENIFVWHDGSYKRIFVCTVLLFEPNPRSLPRVWLNRTWSYWWALWETFSKLQWMMPRPTGAPECPPPAAPRCFGTVSVMTLYES